MHSSRHSFRVIGEELPQTKRQRSVIGCPLLSFRILSSGLAQLCDFWWDVCGRRPHRWRHSGHWYGCVRMEQISFYDDVLHFWRPFFTFYSSWMRRNRGLLVISWMYIHHFSSDTYVQWWRGRMSPVFLHVLEEHGETQRTRDWGGELLLLNDTNLSDVGPVCNSPPQVAEDGAA